MKTVFLAFTLKNSSVADFFVELANRLSLTYKVIIFSHAVEENSLSINKEIIIKKWPSPRPTRMADLVFLQRMIKKYRPQIMISNFAAVNLFLIVGFFYRIPQRIAWYHTLYAQIKKNRILKFRKQFIYKLATHVIANSTASKKDLVEHFGVAKSKIFVVHNALHRAEIINTGNPDQVVYAGRLDAVKGLLTLIKAMSIVVKDYPSVKLHIVGDEKTGDQVEKIKEMVKDLKLTENIIFRGNISRNQVLKEFSKAWFTIVPSHVEAFGYVVIESFSVGTPVVGSKTTGISEIIRDKKDGFLFRVQNFNELAEKMILLLKDHNLRNEMSINCKRNFEENFELSSSVERLNKILNLT
ncbi:glycosyltransferase family 4 protein [Antarcticibacterium sp. 1MA-6-2]|uniref:glycosyltransferase family 4 protein n=1 Tax=Antarcticibacterium sp. 1MA-6-2 TaxID=2908210 RepID=UPI001F214A94|nr:glycosyltransferase family 4 protein [Antarcticibacterium sp. 1MA-6-2]UJH92496.1 glycosyltransferase family 4 protein [Antarcticibacterium sp. 1MA-6-2]